MKPQSLTLDNNNYLLPMTVADHIAFVDLFSSISSIKTESGEEITLRAIHWSVIVCLTNVYNEDNELLLLEFLPEDAFLINFKGPDLSSLSRKQVMETLLTSPEYFYEAIIKASEELSKPWVDEVWGICERELDNIFTDVMGDLKKKEGSQQASTGS